ncbi:hypothetical protein O9929_01760 [Vibrio lentus]|nr:hypothetical protein [Vibrio lentus]
MIKQTKNNCCNEKEQEAPLISELDKRSMMMPNLSRDTERFWLQGYKVGARLMLSLKEDKTSSWSGTRFKSEAEIIKLM